MHFLIVINTWSYWVPSPVSDFANQLALIFCHKIKSEALCKLDWAHSHSWRGVIIWWSYGLCKTFFRVPLSPSQALFLRNVANMCHSAGIPKSSLWHVSVFVLGCRPRAVNSILQWWFYCVFNKLYLIKLNHTSNNLISLPDSNTLFKASYFFK